MPASQWNPLSPPVAKKTQEGARLQATRPRCNDIGGHVIHKPQQASAANKHLQYSDGNYASRVYTLYCFF